MRGFALLIAILVVFVPSAARAAPVCAGALPPGAVQARATCEKTARLKALRLAAEAQAQTETPVQRPAKPPKRRPAHREK